MIAARAEIWLPAAMRKLRLQGLDSESMKRVYDASTRATPQQPFVIDISSLGRRPAAMMTVAQTVSSPRRIGLDLIAIEPGADVELNVRLESVSEGVLVSGTVAAPVRGQCSRCLNPVNSQVDLELTELFVYPGSTTEATTEPEDIGRIIDQTIDLEQVIVDAVGMALPFAPLCSPECPGLCLHCGVVLATAEPDHHHDQIDPRWAALTTLLGTDPDTNTGHDGPAHGQEPS